MHLGGLRRLLSFEKFFNQVDAPARAIELIAQHLIGWAGGLTQAAVHTPAQNIVGLLAKLRNKRPVS